MSATATDYIQIINESRQLIGNQSMVKHLNFQKKSKSCRNDFSNLHNINRFVQRPKRLIIFKPQSPPPQPTLLGHQKECHSQDLCSPSRPASNCLAFRTCYPAKEEPEFILKKRLRTANANGQFNDRGLKYGQASTSMLTEQKYQMLQKLKKNLTSFGGMSFHDRMQQKNARLIFDKHQFSPPVYQTSVVQKTLSPPPPPHIFSRIFSLTKSSVCNCTDGISLPKSFLNPLPISTQKQLQKICILANISPIKNHFKNTWDDQSKCNSLQEQMNNFQPNQQLCYIEKMTSWDDDSVTMPEWIFAALKIKVGDQVSVSIDLSQIKMQGQLKRISAKKVVMQPMNINYIEMAMGASINERIKQGMQSYKILNLGQILKFEANQRVYEFKLDKIEGEKKADTFYTNFKADDLDVELQIGDFSGSEQNQKDTTIRPVLNDGLDLDLIFEERGLDLYYMEQIIQQHQEAKEIHKARKSQKKRASQPNSPTKESQKYSMEIIKVEKQSGLHIESSSPSIKINSSLSNKSDMPGGNFLQIKLKKNALTRASMDKSVSSQNSTPTRKKEIMTGTVGSLSMPNDTETVRETACFDFQMKILQQNIHQAQKLNKLLVAGEDQIYTGSPQKFKDYEAELIRKKYHQVYGSEQEIIGEEGMTAGNSTEKDKQNSVTNDYRDEFDHLSNRMGKINEPQTSLIPKNAWGGCPSPTVELLENKVPNKIIVSTGEEHRSNRSPVVTKMRRKPLRQDTEPLINHVNQGTATNNQQQAMMSLHLNKNQISEVETVTNYAETLHLGKQGKSTNQPSVMAHNSPHHLGHHLIRNLKGTQNSLSTNTIKDRRDSCDDDMAGEEFGPIRHGQVSIITSEGGQEFSNADNRDLINELARAASPKTNDSDTSAHRLVARLLERLIKPNPRQMNKASKSLQSIYQKRVKGSALHGYNGGKSLITSDFLEKNKKDLYAFNRPFSKFKTDVLRGTISPHLQIPRGPSIEAQGLPNKYGLKKPEIKNPDFSENFELLPQVCSILQKSNDNTGFFNYFHDQMMKLNAHKGESEFAQEFYEILLSAAQGDDYLPKLEVFIGKPQQKQRKTINLQKKDKNVKSSTTAYNVDLLSSSQKCLLTTMQQQVVLDTPGTPNSPLSHRKEMNFEEAVNKVDQPTSPPSTRIQNIKKGLQKLAINNQNLQAALSQERVLESRHKLSDQSKRLSSPLGFSSTYDNMNIKLNVVEPIKTPNEHVMKSIEKLMPHDKKQEKLLQAAEWVEVDQNPKHLTEIQKKKQSLKKGSPNIRFKPKSESPQPVDKSNMPTKPFIQTHTISLDPLKDFRSKSRTRGFRTLQHKEGPVVSIPSKKDYKISQTKRFPLKNMNLNAARKRNNQVNKYSEYSLTGGDFSSSFIIASRKMPKINIQDQFYFV